MPLGDITPERLQQLLVEVAHGEVLRYKAAIQDALEQGWLLWQINSSQSRFRGYMANTIVEDLPLVLEPSYLDLYHMQPPMAPDLQALQLWNEVQQQSQQTGQPISDTSKLFWGMLLVLPKWVFQKFQSDFITLAKQYLSREVTSGAPPLPAMPAAGQLPPENPGQDNAPQENAGPEPPVLPQMS